MFQSTKTKLFKKGCLLFEIKNVVSMEKKYNSVSISTETHSNDQSVPSNFISEIIKYIHVAFCLYHISRVVTVRKCFKYK